MPLFRITPTTPHRHQRRQRPHERFSISGVSSAALKRQKNAVSRSRDGSGCLETANRSLFNFPSLPERRPETESRALFRRETNLASFGKASALDDSREPAALSVGVSSDAPESLEAALRDFSRVFSSSFFSVSSHSFSLSFSRKTEGERPALSLYESLPLRRRDVKGKGKHTRPLGDSRERQTRKHRNTTLEPQAPTSSSLPSASPVSTLSRQSSQHHHRPGGHLLGPNCFLPAPAPLPGDTW